MRLGPFIRRWVELGLPTCSGRARAAFGRCKAQPAGDARAGRTFELADLALGQLPDLSDPQRRAECAAHVHKLRGSAGVLGAEQAQRWAARAESALRTGATPPQAASVLEGLSSALAAVRESALPVLERARGEHRVQAEAAIALDGNDLRR